MDFVHFLHSWRVAQNARHGELSFSKKPLKFFECGVHARKRINDAGLHDVFCQADRWFIVIERR